MGIEIIEAGKMGGGEAGKLGSCDAGI